MNAQTMTNEELYNNFLTNIENKVHTTNNLTVEMFWNLFYLPLFRGRMENK